MTKCTYFVDIFVEKTGLMSQHRESVFEPLYNSQHKLFVSIIAAVFFISFIIDIILTIICLLV